jgi:hypothetical protein
MHEQQQQKPGKCHISKLLDNYLAEIAKYPNLSITKFQVFSWIIPRKSSPNYPNTENTMRDPLANQHNPMNSIYFSRLKSLQNSSQTKRRE